MMFKLYYKVTFLLFILLRMTYRARGTLVQ